MTSILARVDRANNLPVVFVADSVDYANNTVLSWVKGEPQVVSLNYYHATGPLSAADEEIMRQRYARHFQDSDVIVRQRLPRQTREVVSILAKAPKQPAAKPAPAVVTPEPVVHNKRATDVVEAPVPAPATQPAPPTAEQLLAALEMQRVEFTKQMAEAQAQIAQALAQLNTVTVHPRNNRKVGNAPAKKAAKSLVVSKGRKPAAKPISTKL